MGQSSFFTTYSLKAEPGSVAEGKEDQYFAGLWIQMEKGTPVGYFKPTKCEGLYDPMMQTPAFTNQIKGQWCADQGNSTVKVQNFDDNNKDESSFEYFFVLDSCEHLKNVTGFTDCKPHDEAVAALDTVYVKTKIQTEQWNSKNFLRNGWQMNSVFTNNVVQLSSAAYQRVSYKIQQTKVNFHDSYFLNAAYLKNIDPGNNYVAYAPAQPFTYNYMVPKNKTALDKHNPLNTFYSVQFAQSGVTTTVTSSREALANTFQRFGSFLALSLRFIGYVLSAYQRFSIDNSMTKKLYSYGRNDNDEEYPHERRPQEHADKHGYQRALLNELGGNNRTEFRYSGWRFFQLKNFGSPWCFCCRFRERHLDKLQQKAKKKLYAEIDILEIIKKLRVARFASDCTLAPHQRDLVCFHQDYKLDSNVRNVEAFDAQHYEAYRPTYGEVATTSLPSINKARDNEAGSKVVAAVNKLDPLHSNIDRVTYARIMGEHLQADEEPLELDAAHRGLRDNPGLISKTMPLLP